MTVPAKFNAFALRIAKKTLGGTPDTCLIQRLTETSDGRGRFTESPSTLLSGIPCRFSDQIQREQTVAGAPQGLLDGIVYLPATLNGAAVGLKDKDRIVVNARGLEPARTFEVIGFGPGEGVLISAMVRTVQA